MQDEENNTSSDKAGTVPSEKETQFIQFKNVGIGEEFYISSYAKREDWKKCIKKDLVNSESEDGTIHVFDPNFIIIIRKKKVILKSSLPNLDMLVDPSRFYVDLEEMITEMVDKMNEGLLLNIYDTSPDVWLLAILDQLQRASRECLNYPQFRTRLLCCCSLITLGILKGDQLGEDKMEDQVTKFYPNPNS